VKTKTDPATQTAFTDDGRPTDTLSASELADAYFDRKSRVDLFKPTADRTDALAKEIRKRFESQAADQTFELRGVEGVVQIGQKQTQRSLTSLYQLYKLSKLKIEEFLAKCAITLSLAETISGSDTLIEEARSGPRSLKAVKRMPVSE